ncbi:MAG: hypothetical protein GY723_03205 [bacterium]|nr:hypothetical protein [bacterium]
MCVHLVDGHVYIFRAYYSIPEILAPDGTPTQAAYGFASTLLRFLSERRPTHLVCCFDYGMKSFRNDVFPGYKASRADAVPEDLVPQFEICKQVARALGLPVFEAAGYEADDVIATLVDGLSAEGCRVDVVSSDKDLSQLVTEDGRVRLHDLQRSRTLDADGVREKFGVDPAQIPDYLALVGDAVDDLPGVPGYGKKSAAIALTAFGRIDQIPDQLAGWEGVAVRGAARLAREIGAHREQALQVRELATVVRKVPGVRSDLGDLTWGGAPAGAFEALCNELGWGQIADRIPRPPRTH